MISYIGEVDTAQERGEVADIMDGRGEHLHRQRFFEALARTRSGSGLLQAQVGLLAT